MGPPSKAVVEARAAAPAAAPRGSLALAPLHQPAAGPPPRSGEELSVVDPERALAILYAPAPLRPALGALFALDERMGGIVATTTEPMIGLMRLAWWREALERLESGPAPAEPLLQAVALHVLPAVATGAALAELEDGWAALLDGDPDAAAIARHGRERGGRLFTCAAQMLCPGEDASIAAAGTGWALADLAHRHSAPAVRAAARIQARAALAEAPRRWPAALRPLGALTLLARRDAMTEVRHQGAPGRALRMLALRLTGR